MQRAGESKGDRMLYSEEYTNRPGPQVMKKIILLAAGLIMGLIISHILFTVCVAGDDAMLPGLKKKSRVIIFKIGTPERGDIVLFKSPVDNGRVLLRRLVAAEGDDIEINNKKISINGKQIKFTWKTKRKDIRDFPSWLTYRDNMKKLMLGRGEYFLLGDNLDNAYDSRTFGIVKSDGIIGYMLYSF
jgi:signal peptidase I